MDDPFNLAKVLWPEIVLADYQQEILQSVWQNTETVVVAGHELGKDFASGLVAVLFFLLHNPCRIITTSVTDNHLRVLWGEINRFIDTARVPLLYSDGGLLVERHRDLRRVDPQTGKECKISYCQGIVSAQSESIAGHHAKHTLLIIDEASGVDDQTYRRGCTWAKKRLVIGNPYPCENFFSRAVEEGSME